MYPDVSPSSSYSKSRAQLFNGIIEPFKIRTDVYDLDTFAKTDPVRPNKLTGQLMDDIDLFQFLSETLNNGFAPYEDMASSTKVAGSLLETSYVSSEKYISDPYIDRDSVKTAVDIEIKNLLTQRLSGNEGILPSGAIAGSRGTIALSLIHI